MTLTHSLAEIMQQLLIDLNLGTMPGPPHGTWPVFATGEPTDPEDVISVRDTQGIQFGRHMGDGEFYEDQGAIIRVRAATHVAARTKIFAITDALDKTVYRTYVTVGGIGYCVHSVQRTGRPIPIGKESPVSRRTVFVLNVLVSVKEA